MLSTKQFCLILYLSKFCMKLLADHAESSYACRSAAFLDVLWALCTQGILWEAVDFNIHVIWTRKRLNLNVQFQ